MIHCVECPECHGILYKVTVDTSADPDKANIQSFYSHLRSDRQIDNAVADKELCCYWLTELEGLKSVL